MNIWKKSGMSDQQNIPSTHLFYFPLAFHFMVTPHVHVSVRFRRSPFHHRLATAMISTAGSHTLRSTYMFSSVYRVNPGEAEYVHRIKGKCALPDSFRYYCVLM